MAGGYSPGTLRDIRDVNRAAAIREIDSPRPWDIVIVGGGATGLGCALDAASRGLRTLLVEQGDFAQATSSRSTKLIHGGVRYLQKGQVGLVREALREREWLLENAAAWVRPISFVLPIRSTWERIFYGIGLALYDGLAVGSRMRGTRHLDCEALFHTVPGLAPASASGGVVYADAQFDDAGLALAVASTANAHGAVVVNYMRVVRILPDGTGRARELEIEDVETGAVYRPRAKVIINATGVFADSLRQGGTPDSKIVTASQGAHIVLPGAAFPGTHALIVPKTSDGRVVFAIPWGGHIVIGTTDLPVAEPTLEPIPREDEITFLLETIRPYLQRSIERTDIRSVFAGLRPLIHSQPGPTSQISREHLVELGSDGLITVVGGKWTTFRRMAEDVVDMAGRVGDFPFTPCITRNLEIGPGPASRGRSFDESPLMCTREDIVYAVEHQMARTVADVLARRRRILFLDARAAGQHAPFVASTMASLLNQSQSWELEQITRFRRLASGYLA